MKQYVLIVDDEFGLADVVRQILIDDGYDAAVAINGREGLERLQQRSADIVLLDMMMPKLDGPGMLAEMRAMSAFKDTPVVLMTALPENLRDVDPALYQGVLFKPYSAVQLFDVLRKFLP
jgi:CheY-like chemotaxis protein